MLRTLDILNTYVNFAIISDLQLIIWCLEQCLEHFQIPMLTFHYFKSTINKQLIISSELYTFLNMHFNLIKLIISHLLEINLSITKWA